MGGFGVNCYCGVDFCLCYGCCGFCRIVGYGYGGGYYGFYCVLVKWLLGEYYVGL